MNGLKAHKCPSCGLIWLDEKQNPEDYYEEKANNLEDIKIKDRLANCRDRLKTFSRLTGINDWLDIGCGEGIFLTALKEFGAERILGIEPNTEMRNYGQKAGLPIIEGRIENLSAELEKNNFYPRVMSLFHVIEHLPDPSLSLKFIYNNLPSGGFVIIETPKSDCYSFVKNNYQHKLIYKDHLFYFNETNLKMIIEKVGFRFVKSGIRDFDINGLPLKEILFRLSLFHRREVVSVMSTAENGIRLNGASKKKIINRLLARVLLPIIIFLRRLDYVWVVAQKP